MPVDPKNFSYHKAVVAVQVFDEADDAAAQSYVDAVVKRLGTEAAGDPSLAAQLSDLRGFLMMAQALAPLARAKDQVDEYAKEMLK